MKKITLFITTIVVTLSSIVAQVPEWQDIATASVGRENPRSYFMSYDNMQDAIQGDFTKSRYYIPLNGFWRFKYLNNHKDIPQGFYEPSYDVQSWDTIQVPTNWELQGYGTAIYTNHGYEFKPKNPEPPSLPEEVPVGLYKRTFDLPLSWRDRNIFLHIGGIKSGTYVYINGAKVGYTEDSKSAAEFRVNDYIKEGENTIAFETYRWTAGSYLECQDYWRISGVERDVYLYSQPATYIEDYYITSTLDSTYTDGLFSVKIALNNSFVQTTGYMQVWAELFDIQGDPVTYHYSEKDMNANSRDTVTLSREIRDVHQWSAESPYLYTLVLKIKQDGRFTEYITQKVGFRTSEVKGNQYYVNGKRVYIKGVNYHETHPTTGHYLDEKTIIKDMRLMKEANVNAIRLSHYPQQRLFYELADKYGFYVCNEANIESHGMYYDLKKGGSLGNNPLWLNKHMDRIQNMYHQTKNYPCVMFWSLGNEAGNGYNFYETYLWLKSVDRSRPVQYERALLEWNTDIFCPQYPSARTLELWGKMTTDRPCIPSEYAHAMGNSTGNFRDQWDMIYKYDNLQGGFIWDWVDQAFLEYNEDSTKYWWAYGGDYGVNAPSDGNFLCNGVVSADRVARPGFYEIQKVHQYVQFSEVDPAKGLFNVKNIYDFTSLNKFSIVATIYNGSRVVTRQIVPLSLAPGEEQEVRIRAIPTLKRSKDEYFVNFSVKLKANDGLLKKGFQVASDQFVLPIEPIKLKYVNRGGALKFAELDDNSMEFSSRYFSVQIDDTTGFLRSYKIHGVEMLYDGYSMRPNFWRAPTDNDYGSRMPYHAKEWRAISLGDSIEQMWEASSIEVQNVNAGVSAVIVSYDNLPDSTKLKLTYKIYSSGVINVNYAFTGNPRSKMQIPRQGLRLRLPASYSVMEYFGRGPEENYSDRKYGTDIGLYRSDAKEEMVEYVRLQETGHHTDARYLAMTNKRGSGLMFVADSLIEFNALSASVEDYDGESSDKPYQWNNFSDDEVQEPAESFLKLKKQTHINDIEVRPYVEVSIDGRMMGVGGDDSWYARPYPQYVINTSDSFSYGFSLVPVRNLSDVRRNSNLKF